MPLKNYPKLAKEQHYNGSQVTVEFLGMKYLTTLPKKEEIKHNQYLIWPSQNKKHISNETFWKNGQKSIQNTMKNDPIINWQEKTKSQFLDLELSIIDWNNISSELELKTRQFAIVTQAHRMQTISWITAHFITVKETDSGRKRQRCNRSFMETQISLRDPQASWQKLGCVLKDVHWGNEEEEEEEKEFGLNGSKPATDWRPVKGDRPVSSCPLHASETGISSGSMGLMAQWTFIPTTASPNIYIRLLNLPLPPPSPY